MGIKGLNNAMSGKKILAGAVILAAAGAAGYGYAWSKHAEAVRTFVEGADNKFIATEHQGVSGGGFPLSVRTVVAQPQFRLNAEYLYKKKLEGVFDAFSSGEQGKAVFGDWDETLTFEGNLIIEQKPFSKKARLSTDGERIYHRSEIDGEVVYNTLYPGEGAYIEIDMEHPDVEKAILAFTEKGKNAPINAGAALDGTVTLHAGKTAFNKRDGNGENGQPAFTAENFSLSFGGENGKATLNAEIKDGRFYPRMTRLLRLHYARLFGKRKAPDGLFSKILNPGDEPFSAAADIKGAAGEKPAYDIKASYATPDMRFATEGNIAFTGAGAADVHLINTADVNEAWYGKTRSTVTRFIARAMKDPDNWHMLDPFFRGKAERTYNRYRNTPRRFSAAASQSAYQLLPELHAFGAVRTEVNGVFTVKNNALLADEVREVSFTSTPYDLFITRKEGAKDEFTVKARNYTALVDDISDYSEEVMTASARFDPAVIRISLKEGFSETAALLLESLQAEGSGKDPDMLTLPVAFKDDVAVIGGRQFPEIMGEAALMLTPYVAFKRSGS